jgi:Cu(I)/Ag(I) efflux system membrane protein CusA/SilA
MLNSLIRFFLYNKLITALLLIALVGWGLITAPFNWSLDPLPRDPVPLDAIPNIGPNQQIVFTKWKGHSPQDIQDQITYPLTTQLLGVPGVKTVRSNSMFGFSSIYIIFKEDVAFYWSRSRILEELNSLPEGTLPDGVQPQLGPDATALGQIYWYTLEGRDTAGNPTGGWDPQELRTVQDSYVKYALSSADGVAEVASIGGYVKEYQVDVRPAAMKAHDINLAQVQKAVQETNLDVGASTVEINNAEYVVRGLGYIENLDDLKKATITSRNNTPIQVEDVARVSMGPASRRGALDKAGAPAVGGVVVARYGANPMEVIRNVKDQIRQIDDGLPRKTLEDGTVSKVEIVPFYDRSGLIQETLGTLEEALTLEVLITILVILIMVVNLRASLLISSLLPVAVLMVFIMMQYTDVDANIVALAGIAIAIGTMVDVGIILTENMLRHWREAPADKSGLAVIYEATSEVATAVLTAIATTIISFIPVFALQGSAGKLFGPLAFTKTFALFAAIVVALLVIPALAHSIFSLRFSRARMRIGLNSLLLLTGIAVGLFYGTYSGLWISFLALAGLAQDFRAYFPTLLQPVIRHLFTGIVVLGVVYLLAYTWLPLSPERSLLANMLFVALIVGLLLSAFQLIIHYYRPILSWMLSNKKPFLSLPLALVLLGSVSWLGFGTVFGFVAQGFDKLNVNIRQTSAWQAMSSTFPGIGKEFMPTLDEGSFLLMPTTAPHVGVEASKELMQAQDKAVQAIPEVKSVVGKLGRVESALDPAPVSMYETVINYKSEYKCGPDGQRLRFKVDEEGQFVRDSAGNLIRDPYGQYFRQWRDQIQTKEDIWQAITDAIKPIPGITSAPKLQPIETRLIMLQSGMKAPLGIKVRGPDLQTIGDFSLRLEEALKEVPELKAKSVYAERLMGKPYLEIDLDRQELSRYGLSVKDVQQYIEVGIGGKKLTTTVEGRKRFPVRVRYPRELRDDPKAMRNILIPTSDGQQIPLGAVTDIQYRQGPKAIKSENTFLTNYITFGKKDGIAQVEAVQATKQHLEDLQQKGELSIPRGVSYEFAGDFKNQQQASRRLAFAIPVSLLIIFLILYLQFRSVITTSMILSSIAVAMGGGFILLWLYGQDWFFNVNLFGQNLQDLFQIRKINLSVAVWVGFIALFGIAVDGAVVIATYLDQRFKRFQPASLTDIRQTVIEAGAMRIRPTLMTTATTILALLPILTSTGKGANILVPMAIPTVGGMLVQVITLFVLPVLYAMWKEKQNDAQ